MNINWSVEAVDDFEKNIQYLRREFSQKDIIQFINKTENILHKISTKPKLFRETNYRDIHAVPIVPAITLFYRIISDNEVELIRFWNNYQNPDSLILK